MIDIKMTDMMTAMMTDIMVTNQDIVMVIEKKEIGIMKTITYRKRYRSPSIHDPRKSERYPNCPDTQIEEQMDEIVQNSVNILKNVNKHLNK